MVGNECSNLWSQTFDGHAQNIRKRFFFFFAINHRLAPNIRKEKSQARSNISKWTSSSLTNFWHHWRSIKRTIRSYDVKNKLSRVSWAHKHWQVKRTPAVRGEQLLLTIPYTLTISFLSKARAASRLAGLFASRLSVLFLPRLRSSWIMVFFTYILSMSLHEPPLELRSPLRLLGRGGRPSIQASTPPAAPFPTLPFMLTFTNNPLCLQSRVQ